VLVHQYIYKPRAYGVYAVEIWTVMDHGHDDHAITSRVSQGPADFCFEPDGLLEAHKARVEALRNMLDRVEVSLNCGLSCAHPSAKVSHLAAAVDTLLQAHALSKVQRINL
jgi:hypothetical protein